MGNRKRRRALFFEQHPWCCFCGGGKKAEEEDHVPSRSCFDGRNWPEGFVFPSCFDCNHETASGEQVIALYSRMLSAADVTVSSTEITSLIASVAKNFPETIYGIRRLQSFRTPELETLHELELPLTVSTIIETILKKWARAFHYKETRRIVPIDAAIIAAFVPNTETDFEPYFQGLSHKMVRSNHDLLDQIGYVTLNDPLDDTLGRYTVAFRRSFIGVMIVDIDRKLDVNDKSLTLLIRPE